MLKARDFRVWWAGDEKGWMIDTEFGLSPQVVERIRSYTLTVQQQRRMGLLPGTKRDELDRTIRALEGGRISQNIAGPGDRVLFDSYKSEKIIVGA